MFSQVEFRSVIRFLILKKMKAKDIIEELHSVYGEHAPAERTIYEWIAAFKHGRISVFDQERSGRPCEISDNKKDQLAHTIRTNRRITTRALSDSLNVSKGTIYALMKDLGIRKLCSRFVPHFLTEEMMRNRLTCCEGNLSLLSHLGNDFLSDIVTMDETPLSLYSVESKRESMEWKFPHETASRKLRSSASHRKALMLTIFWDRRGVVSMDFTDGKCNSEYYIQQMLEARKNRRKNRNRELFLLQDNAAVHTSNMSQSAILKAGFKILSHPPYSPDLAPSDFYLFTHLKKELRGKRFQDKEELKGFVNDYLCSQNEEFFNVAFDQLVIRWKKCIDNLGSYIEK